jgi:predicted transcriptional regulator
MAATLGLSVSYLSQLENDDRPITPAVAAALERSFPLDWPPAGAETASSRTDVFLRAIADPLFAGLEQTDGFVRAAEQQPALVDRFLRLHAAYRAAEERRQIVDEALSSGAPGGGRLPWEEVRDWFHESGNYIDVLDRAGERLSVELDAEPLSDMLLQRRLKETYGIDVLAASDDAPSRPLRSFDRARGILVLDRAMPIETRRFFLAQALASLAFDAEIAAVIAGTDLSPGAQHLLQLGLANYAAAALVMPYARFRDVARRVRHDIDRLCQRFGVSFEQACHRLSTLQRPGMRGVPMFFCRVDMAGNITKRHSATRLQFARFGGACPLWIVHEAVAIPDRILVQLAETPDGVRYVSMAKGLVKPSGSYVRSPRRFAVALGCEVEHASEFIYADGLDLTRGDAATRIGVSCRLCARIDCDQRAFPPADRSIVIDPDVRDVVPYRVL